MVVIILAAGYATRLYPLTKDVPKALLQIGARPLLDHLMDKVRAVPDVKEAVLVTNNRFARQFEAWASAQKKGPPIRVLNDGTNSNDDRLGAIGDLQFAVEKRGVKDDILVLASDNLFDGELSGFVASAASKPDAAAIGVYDLKDPMIGAKRYGIIRTDPERRILSIDEKPERPRSPLASMGIYYFPASSLKYIREYLSSLQKQDAPGYYATWLLERTKIYAYVFSGKWYDIGSFEQLDEAKAAYSSK